jgi:hypothetical protein
MIFSHGKSPENRSWNTGYRGPLLIHAAKSWQSAGLQLAQELGITDLSWDQQDYPTGIVGIVDLVEVCYCRRTGRDCPCGPWAARGQYHWRLTNPRPFAQPAPCKGALQLWRPSDEVLDAVRVQLAGGGQ